MTRLLLTVPEAAEVLAISRSKLYELLAPVWCDRFA
jgi:predicted DNA-binding transcriptional regulator AlpA